MSKVLKIALLALLVVVGAAGAAGTSGSAPGFKASREFDTSAKDANSVALGDLNGDGKLDVVATHGAFDDDPPALKSLRLVSVLYGRGDGRLVALPTSTRSAGPATRRAPSRSRWAT